MVLFQESLGLARSVFLARVEYWSIGNVEKHN